MLRAFIRRLTGAPASGGPSMVPEFLNLENRREVRVVLPRIAGSHAALLNSPQGFYIFDRRDDGIDWQKNAFDAYDVARLDMLARLARAAPPDPVILDIGAHIGVATIMFSRVAGPGGLVHAFEAQRGLFHMLAGNVALNSVDNVRCHHRAVGDTRESIDALALPRVDLIRLAGADAQAILSGALATLRAYQPLVCVGNTNGDSGGQDLRRTLSEVGYLLYDVPGNMLCIPGGHVNAGTLAEGLVAWAPPV